MPKATDVVTAFATPILVRDIADATAVNAALKATILKRESASRGVHQSNAGGWHSRPDLLSWTTPEVTQLRRWLLAGIADITTASGKVAANAITVRTLIAWANVSRRGNYNKLHEHPRSDWSGVYYVAAGSPPKPGQESGNIEFLDPRGAVGTRGTPGQGFGVKLKFQPRDGMMLIFPSWVWHLVQPYDGAEERISIAFNADVERASARRRIVATASPGQRPKRLH